MNIKGFRRMLVGEKIPDKNDPQYKERYERDVNAGRKFAKATRIDKMAAKIQEFANRNKILFLSSAHSHSTSTVWQKPTTTDRKREVPRKYRTACSGNGTRIW